MPTGTVIMEFITLGKTNLLVSRTAFGAMSLDCKEMEAFGQQAEEKACAIVHQAYDAGINFFDISRSKVTCEKRLGSALHGIRQNVILSTKSQAFTAEQLVIDLNESLESLESDYIDLYSLESPKTLPSPTNNGELYSALEKFKEKGLVRHTGIATDNLDIAQQALESGLYEVIQFPFNMISSHIVADFVKECAEKNVGFIAMQPLNGGVITNIPLAFGFLNEFENVVPVWGVHTQEELEQILYFTDHPPVIDEKFKAEVEQARMFFN